MGVSPQSRPGDVESFYHLFGVDLRNRPCRGLACIAASKTSPANGDPPVYCVGKCYEAPACTDSYSTPKVQIACKTPVLLTDLSFGEALAKAKSLGAEAVLDSLDRSLLRGRGGAGFPAGRKWRAVAAQASTEKYVVANGDEGDHGSYIDRVLMERYPERILEALAIAGFAVGAAKGYIYVRKEYPFACEAIARAISQYEFDGFSVEMFVGEGSYLCGEETALLNSIEHRRPEVRARPPYPFQEGLFGKPTLVNNIETLASVPWIVLEGGDAYAKLGKGDSRGTKAVCLNSLFNEPGMYEVEFGLPLAEIVYTLGGGLKDGGLKALVIGGPLAGFVLPTELETAFTFEDLHSIGASVGHGGIIAFNESTSMRDILHAVFEFGAFESCGKCTPCRIGSREIEQVLARGGGCLGKMDQTLKAMLLTSLCGHGSGLAVAARSALKKFPEEMSTCFA